MAQLLQHLGLELARVRQRRGLCWMVKIDCSQLNDMPPVVLLERKLDVMKNCFFFIEVCFS